MARQLSRINRYLASGEELQPLYEKAQEIRALSKLCVDVLPSELAAQVRGANIREGSLVILAATPSAAAKVKLYAGTFAETLLRLGAKVNGVSVRVQPIPPEGQHGAVQKTAVMTPAAAALLADLHARLPDSPAREALGRLLANSSDRAEDPLAE
jgi:hypothetical protein